MITLNLDGSEEQNECKGQNMFVDTGIGSGLLLAAAWSAFSLQFESIIVQSAPF